MTERYIDPNSGAAPQPGGYAGAPVVDEGQFDAAVADEVTELQEQEDLMKEQGSDGREDDSASEEKVPNTSRRRGKAAKAAHGDDDSTDSNDASK